jgi:phosphoribosylglycinamide formyltransferase-1
MKRIVILISGRGSNMQAVLGAKLDAAIAAVISNNPTAKGLQIAHDAGVDTKVVNHRDYPDRTSFDRALADTIAAYRPDLIVLAGFMRILTAEFIGRFSGKIMNIHPSLLPAFPGLDTHRRAIDEGVKPHWTTGRSSFRRPCRCCPTMTRNALPPGCSNRSTPSIRWPSAGSWTANSQSKATA